ncbi:hypothetical protein [Streptomyces sp. NPDC002952]|uniref:3'-5' exonuclease n=1 Tax=Streptomyces sp. NPDC002952 TaxID=3364673 RepID=UPI00369F9EE7
MTTIAFVDCETTHLDAEIGEVWEVAVILREDNDPATDTEYLWEFSIDPETVDPEALHVGRWHDRHQLPARTNQAAFTGSVPAVMMSRTEAVNAIVNVLSGAVLVGSNPGFDDRFLRKLLGPGAAQWHYRPYDIVQLAAAKIGAQQAGPLPWRTHVLSRAVGIEPPAKDVAHTALGDARWARDVHDAAMVREKYPLTWEGRAQHAIGLYTQTACELDDARRALAASNETVTRLRERHTSSLRRADQINNELMAEVQRYADGTERPVLWSVYNRMHSRAASAEAATERARAVLAEPWLAAPHGDDRHDHLCPDDVRKALTEALDGPSTPVTQTERAHWVDIAAALNAAQVAGMSVGIDLDGTLTDHTAWSVIWDSETERWTVAGYDADKDQDDDSDEEIEETGDADGDVLELISEIASRLSDATDGGEYHAVNLISDLANGRKTIAEAREELAEITFRHV